jgi:hypothetical protein
MVLSHSLSLALQSTVCTVMYSSSYRWLGKTLSQLAWHPWQSTHASDMPTVHVRARMAGQAAASDK